MLQARRASLALFVISLAAASTLAAQELPQARPESVGMSSERLGRITTALKRYVDEDRLPGAVAMVLRQGKVVYS